MPSSSLYKVLTCLPRCTLVFALVQATDAWAQTPPLANVNLTADTQTHAPVQITEQALPFRQFEKVEITGSSITRKEQTQTLPVQIITRQDLQRRGYLTLVDAVQNLSNVFNGLELTQTGMNQGGFTSAALHGMATGTLVLLNGKRLAPYGIQNISGKEQASVDLGMLPLTVVDRIEVLSDGASSLYGSDAIAGVINIITRSDIRGVEMSAETSHPQGGAGQGSVARISWGKGHLQRDGYSVRISGEVDHYDRVRTADRPYAAQGRIMLEHAGNNLAVDSSHVTAFTSPAQIYSPNTTKKMWSGLYSDGNCQNNGLDYFGYKGGCKANFLPTLDIYPERSSRKLYVTGELLFSQNTTLYAELLYSDQQTDIGANIWPRIAGRISNTPGAAGYDLMLANGMDPAYGFYYWQANLPALKQGFDKSLWRASVGIKGVHGHWNFHASLYQSRSHTDQSFEQANLGSYNIGQGQRLGNPLLLQALDALNPLTSQLLDSRSWIHDATGQTTLTGAEWRASRSLMELDGKDVLFGWGLETRHEQAQTRFLQGTDRPSFEAQRYNVAAYGELQVPLRHNWDLIGSLRSDQYNDVGRTIQGKVSTRWAISPQWAARAAWGTGFRAPSIGQVQQLDTAFRLYSVPLTKCLPELVEIAGKIQTSDGLPVLCRENGVASVYANGNPELKPETSRQTSFGLAFTPHRNFHLLMDFWRVDMKNTLQFDNSADVLANPAKYPSAFIGHPSVVSLNNGLINFHDLALSLRMRNLGQSVKSGVDIDIGYRTPGQWARWFFGAQATYMLTSRERISPDAAWASDLGQYSTLSDAVVPRWRSRWLLGLQKNDLQVHLSVNHTSGYKDRNVSAYNLDKGIYQTLQDLRVPSFVTADVLGLYQLTRSTQLRAGVTNLLNRQPPQSFYSPTNAVWGVNSRNGSLMGRTLQLGLNIKF